MENGARPLTIRQAEGLVKKIRPPNKKRVIHRVILRLNPKNEPEK